MVYHLENWEFMRDMMCSNPGWVAGDIADILEKEMHIPVPETHRQRFERLVKECGCVKTQEGLETCLNISREDIAPKWLGIHPENREFEIFLQKLDERMKGYRTDFFEKHIL